MFSLAKILAPVDFSVRSPGGVRYSGWLACHFRSELTLLHVLDSIVDEFSVREALDPAVRKLSEKWRSRTEALLANFMLSELPNHDPRVRRIVSTGHPAEEIVRFVGSEHTSLLVIPTCGFEPFRSCLLGSVVSRILHDAGCPVLTSPHAQEGFPEPIGFRKILCAVDFRPQSLKTLAWASQIAGEFQAHLTIAHITPSTEGGVGAYFNPERSGIWATESRHREFAEHARQEIEEMQKTIGATASVLIDSGMDVPQAVCWAAAQIEADLVVVGRERSGSVDRVRTKVCSIVRQSPCPVVSV